jgi:hypothetical protein
MQKFQKALLIRRCDFDNHGIARDLDHEEIRHRWAPGKESDGSGGKAEGVAYPLPFLALDVDWGRLRVKRGQNCTLFGEFHHVAGMASKKSVAFCPGLMVEGHIRSLKQSRSLFTGHDCKWIVSDAGR